MKKLSLQTYLNKFKEKEELPEVSSQKDIEQKEQCLNQDIDETIKIFSDIYSIKDNSDVTLRKFHINGLNKRAALLFISTISDANLIEQQIIHPLIVNQDETKQIEDIVSIKEINSHHIIKEIVNNVNKGNAALFIDGSLTAYSLSVANVQSRSVEKAENETVIKGPKEAFNEKVETNISLIRKKIKNENLIVEEITITKRSHNELYLLYVKDLANDKLVKNIKERVSALHVDSIQNLSLLEQYIEERPKSIFPLILYTERPDRATSFLEDGYVVLLMNNSPSGLILPATFWSFIHNPEDHYLRFLYGNFTRILRFISLFITIFASAIYVSVTNYHAEMVPTDLLLAISATREKVPFPSFVEILMMELAFELIREAGLRVPTPIGPTIGIVGALILGQAAVQANIVSPIVVIVVALSGVCSFTIGDLSMNYTLRIIRFVFIISAGAFGIYGMTAVFTSGLFYMISLKSFGVPYLAPMSPKYVSTKDTIFRKLVKNERIRPGYVKPKDYIKKSEE